MSGEVIDISKAKTSFLPVSKKDLAALKEQRKVLREFVSSELVEADFSNNKAKNYGEGDFGVIPGTKKRCLFKQGAEKLNRLFGLGVRFHHTDQIIERATNFAMYTYKAEIFHLQSGITIAECEGSANSQEDRYKERTVWEEGKGGVRESRKEEMPVFNILNTLMKQAQKRAFVGATLLATGASEFFTQDLLDPEDLVESQPKINPKVNAKEAKPEAGTAPAKESVPECHGRPMMISKYFDPDLGCKPYYCTTCKEKRKP